MATVTLSIARASGQILETVSSTVPDGDVTRAQAAMRGMFPDNTDQQILARALDGLLNRVADLVEARERAAAPVARLSRGKPL